MLRFYFPANTIHGAGLNMGWGMSEQCSDTKEAVYNKSSRAREARETLAKGATYMAGPERLLTTGIVVLL